MSGSTGTKISQLPAATALVSADLIPVTQGGSGGTTRAATVAQLRTAVFDNSTQPVIAVNNASTDLGVTAGFTYDIGGTRRATHVASRNGATPEGRLAFSVTNIAGVLEQIISLQTNGVMLSKPTFFNSDPISSVALVVPGRASDNFARVNFTSNNQGTVYASMVTGPGSFALGVGAGTYAFSATNLTLPADPTTALGAATKQMVDLKANLASPTFTGTVTAPTLTVTGDASTGTTGANPLLRVGSSGSATTARVLISAVTAGTATLAFLKNNSTRVGFEHGTDDVFRLKVYDTGGSFLGDAITVTGVIPSVATAAISTNTTQIATTAFVLAQRGSNNPVMNGTVSAGTSFRFSREDHVHPSDTSRAPIPTNSAGLGQFLSLDTASDVAAVLPAGGTWGYSISLVVASTMVWGGTRQTGVAAGGATVGTATAGNLWSGFCWRIT